MNTSTEHYVFPPLLIIRSKLNHITVYKIVVFYAEKYGLSVCLQFIVNSLPVNAIIIIYFFLIFDFPFFLPNLWNSWADFDWTWQVADGIRRNLGYFFNYLNKFELKEVNMPFREISYLKCQVFCEKLHFLTIPIFKKSVTLPY